MPSDDEIKDLPDRSTDIAREIAQVLGCPLEDFSSPNFSTLDQTCDLLRIWLMIKHEHDRNNVLNYMRAIADQAVVYIED